MADCSHVFQISGIKDPKKKKLLVQGILKLRGRYLGGSVYEHSSTHLIIPQVLSSEKFLAACAAGKWVVTPDYVLDSVTNGFWLSEGSYEVAISTDTISTYYPVRQWRERVASGRIRGAFQDWRVLLMVQEPTRRAMFNRLLQAGRAKVYHCPLPSHASITHVMAKPVTEDSKSHNAPCYPVSYIVHHLFGKSCANMNINITDDTLAETRETGAVDFSKLETELRDYAIKQEGQSRLHFIEFLGYHDLHRPQSQGIETDFSNVGTMIECGFFIEALDSIRSDVFPGLLPPAPYLVSLLEYAQQGNAPSVFLRNFQQVMYRLLITNPPWLAPNTAKKYFAQVLQCPRCKAGLWPFLETIISYCLSRDDTCHPLRGPLLPALLHFHRDLLAFFLKLFQGELHSVTTGEYMLLHGSGVSQESASGSLLYGSFWTVWERSTLLSSAVKRLTQLLVLASAEDCSVMEDKQMVDTLVDLLSVVVEFWCQHHSKLNQHLVEKGLNDLAEHFAIVSQDVSAVVLAELIVKISSTRLKLVMADAIFRNLCCRNAFTLGDEPLSLKKMVLYYLPALETLAQSPSGICLRTEPTFHSSTSMSTGSGNQGTSVRVNESSLEKGNMLRGLNRVNTAGETLLHRACKRNQVETVLQILALPGTDVNIKDHAGWTPLHEACNHGSTSCVAALLRHYPPPVVDNQVGGVSPLHDALVNGHKDIAQMLLEHTGSVLLRRTDGTGRTPLDLMSPSQRDELLHSAQVGDSALRKKAARVLNLPLLEAGSTLLAHLIFSYQQEKGLLHCNQPSGDRGHSLGYRLVMAIKKLSLQNVASGWTDQRAMRLLEDTKTLLELGRGCYLGQVSQGIKECKGENTLFLMEILEDLKLRGVELAADL